MENSLTVIVIFFNGQREAARTLYSLSSEYQRDVNVKDYNVIVLDSGSTKPLDKSWVESFGSNFQYRYVNTENPAPTEALRVGLQMVETEYVGVIIDGAHILTPGILGYFFSIVKLNPDAFVFTTKYHIGDFHQNDSLTLGHNQEKEDQLFETVDWKRNGYLLYHISNFYQSPFFEFSTSSESNCFFVKTEELRNTKVYNKNYYSKGGGLINLDTFKHLTLNSKLENYCLLGEGSFHQFHGGASTNVERIEHPVTEYNMEYYNLNKKPYSSPIYSVKFFGSYDRTIQQFQPLPEFRVIDKFLSTELLKSDPESYKKMLDYGLAQYPFYPTFFNKLSNYYQTFQEFDKAEEILLKLKSIKEKTLPCLIRLTRLKLKTNKYKEALAYINEAIEINPTHIELLLLKAVVHKRNNQNKKVNETINNAIPFLDQEYNINRHCLTIKHLMDLGKWELAHKYYCRFIEIDPNNPKLIQHGLEILPKLNKRNKFEELVNYIFNKSNTRVTAEILKKIGLGYFEIEEYSNCAKYLSRYQSQFGALKGDNLAKKFGLSLYINKSNNELNNFDQDAKNNDALNDETKKFIDGLSQLSNGKEEEALEIFSELIETQYKHDLLQRCLSQTSTDFSILNNKKTLIKLLDHIQTQQHSVGLKLSVLIQLLLKTSGNTSIIPKYNHYTHLKFPKQNLFQKDPTIQEDNKYDGFIFTHIQKTAGTSMRKLFSWSCVLSNIKANKVHIPGEFGLDPRKNTVQLTDSELMDLKEREVKLLLEHISYGAHEKSFLQHMQNPFYFTILREPLTRFKSYYYFFHYKKREGCESHLNDMDDDAFQKYVKQFQNLMTAYIGGKDWFLDIDTSVTKDVLEIAKDNLKNKYATFGLQEDMHNTLDQLRKKSPQWLIIPDLDLPYQNKRAKSRDGEITGAKLEYFKEANQFDFELYDFAKELFYKT